MEVRCAAEDPGRTAVRAAQRQPVLLTKRTGNELTCTCACHGRKNAGAHVEKKNWSNMRIAAGHHRCGGAAEVDQLNDIYASLRRQTTGSFPQQKLVS